LYGRTIDDPKLKILAFEDRWHFIAILCLKSQGVIDSKSHILDKLIAIQLGLTVAELDMVKGRLVDVGLIDKSFQPIAWDNLQFKSDSSIDRVKKYREKQKDKTMKRSCNVTVTAQETDTDTDTDTDKTKRYTSSQRDDPVRVPYSKIVDLYHETLPNHPKVKVLTNARKSSIRQRHVNDMDSDLEEWLSYFNLVKRSKFLTGQTQPVNGRKVFIADLEWICKESNFAKIYEGKYHG